MRTQRFSRRVGIFSRHVGFATFFLIGGYFKHHIRILRPKKHRNRYLTCHNTEFSKIRATERPPFCFWALGASCTIFKVITIQILILDIITKRLIPLTNFFQKVAHGTGFLYIRDQTTGISRSRPYSPVSDARPILEEMVYGCKDIE